MFSEAIVVTPMDHFADRSGFGWGPSDRKVVVDGFLRPA